MAHIDTHVRQQGLVTVDQLNALSVTVVGCGGVGSTAVLQLAKMGIPEMVVYDGDVLEPHNFGNQMLPVSSVDYDWVPRSVEGDYKVDQLEALLGLMVTDLTFNGNTRHWTPADDLYTEIVIAAADSMQVRRDLFEKACETLKCRYFIDARMGAETGRVYVVNLADEKQIVSWLNNWQPDDAYPEVACTTKATIYCASIIGGLITHQVKQIAADKPVHFCTMFDLPNFFFSTIPA